MDKNTIHLAPKLAWSIIISMWTLIVLLIICSIITLSIPGNMGVPRTVPISNVTSHNGWWLISVLGLGKVLRGLSPNTIAWWYSPYHGVTDFHVLISAVTNVLIIVVPVLSILFAIIHYYLVRAVKYPKSIAFIDAIHRNKRAIKKSKRKVRRAIKRQAKGKISRKELDDIKTFWRNEKQSAQENYDKELQLWQTTKDSKQAAYHFGKAFLKTFKH